MATMKPCPYHPDRKPTTVIEGRVLVCDECAADDELREHARKDWR